MEKSEGQMTPEEILKAYDGSTYSYGDATPLGSSYPGKPDVDMKFKGWLGMFGEHFLCELGCKRFASKSLDNILRFIEKEIRHFYEPKQTKKKGKSGVEVKSYLRKSRKKKEEKMDEVDKVTLTDMPEGKVLFIKDKNIKVKDEQNSQRKT